MPKGERGTSKPYLRGQYWWIRFMAGGVEVCESTKSRNKRDAIRLLNQRRAEVDRRVFQPQDALMSDIFDLYVADQKKFRRKGARTCAGYVRLHLGPAFGKLKISEFTSGHLDRFIEQKRIAGLGDGSINRLLAAIKRAFKLGMESIPPIVATMPKIALLPEPPPRTGFLEHEQYLRLRDELPAHAKLLLVIGYHLGMRTGEIKQLRWDQVDWDANLIRLEHAQTKTKNPRTAPLYGELRAWLETGYAARGRCPNIIGWGGKGIESITTAWMKARERAELPHALQHDLRRTAVRNMVRAGVPEKQAMLISGHKTRSVFDRYDITDERDIQAAGARMAEYAKQQTAKAQAKLLQTTKPAEPAPPPN